MHWSWHDGRGLGGRRSSWWCLCCGEVAVVKFGGLEVETGFSDVRCLRGEYLYKGVVRDAGSPKEIV